MFQEQLRALMMEDVDRKLKEIKQQSFKGVNNPGKFLGWQIKKRREKRWINKIKVGGKEILDQEGIKIIYFIILRNYIKNN